MFNHITIIYEIYHIIILIFYSPIFHKEYRKEGNEAKEGCKFLPNPLLKREKGKP